jgi:hypothetical protein
VPEDVLVHATSLTASRWTLILVPGVAAGVLAGLFVGLFTPAPWTAAAACGVLVGALIGSINDLRVRKLWELARSAAGDLPPGPLAAAVRAARSGAVPTDPDIRAAALKIADHQLKTIPSKTVLLSVLPLAFGVVAMITASAAPGWVLAVFVLPAVLAVVFTGVLAWQAFLWPPRLRKRIRLLTAAAGARQS